jgi:hypothetical protein
MDSDGFKLSVIDICGPDYVAASSPVRYKLSAGYPVSFDLIILITCPYFLFPTGIFANK